MKPIKSLALIAMIMTLVSFTTLPTAHEEAAARQLAMNIVDAVQQQSAESYSTLFPSLQEFHHLMESNKETYGLHLKAAQENFEIEYTNSLFPAVQQSFAKLIADGRARGIEWTAVSLTSVHFARSTSQTKSLELVINAAGKEFIIEVVPIQVNGQLKVTQFIRLV